MPLDNVVTHALHRQAIFQGLQGSKQQLDRPVIVAYLIMIVLVFVVINLVVDILYSVLDPRVRLGGREQ